MFWMSAFLDLAPDELDAGVAFWRGVTGYELSPSRGEHGEFATLVPPAGDDHLRVQRLGAGPSRLHLDLHVADPSAAAEAAERQGATIRLRHDLGYVVMASPGGFPFCFVARPASRPAAPAEWEGGLTSVVDQVCLDIPAPAYDAECAFWQELTGWELRHSRDHAEFRRLIRPPDQPLQILLQRLGEETGPVRAHLDLATTDREAETRRHVALGARVLDVTGGWTVLAPPGGPVYCVTGRRPGIRVLDEPSAG
jgi:hypothetical protein